MRQTTPSALSNGWVRPFYCKKTQGTQDMLKAQTGEAGKGSVLRAPSNVARGDGDGKRKDFVVI